MKEDDLNSLIVVDEKVDDAVLFDNLVQYLNSIDTGTLIKDSIPLDKWDWIIVAVSGILGGLADLVIGNPKGFDEPKIKNDSMFGLGEKIKAYDMKNNPIDFQDLKSFGGDHRLYSYGHDLTRFFEDVRQIMVGQYKGIYSGGSGGEIVKDFAGYTQIPFEKAIIIILLHLIKDFCTAKSLPIPGMTYLAKLNNNKMPEFAQKLYCDHGFNLRVLSGQVLSVAINEIIIRVYFGIRYHNETVDKDLLDEKRNKMLLMGHSISMIFNIGKVIVTKNPFMLNIPQLLMILRYILKLLNKQYQDYLKRKKNFKEGIELTGNYLIVQAQLINNLNSIIQTYEEVIQTNETMIQEYKQLIASSEQLQEENQSINDKFTEIKKYLEG